MFRVVCRHLIFLRFKIYVVILGNPEIATSRAFQERCYCAQAAKAAQVHFIVRYRTVTKRPRVFYVNVRYI
jgi:hypothetical protein